MTETMPDALKPLWFDPRPCYEGLGTIVLDKSARILRGPSSFRIADDGHAEAEIQIVEEVPSASEAEGLGATGEWPPDRARVSSVTAIPGPIPEIKDFALQTPMGALRAIGQCWWTERRARQLGTGTVAVWKLDLTQSVFSAVGFEQARYWVAPLVNFVSPYRDYPEPVDGHPLRFRSVRASAELSENERLVRCLFGPGSDGVIRFDFGGKAFVQPLLDHEELERRLRSGEIGRSITAVMVGEVGGRPVDPSRTPEWIPFDFADLLSLASGTYTAIPWIELRAADGALVGRFHLHAECKPFTAGDEAILEGVGTGRLLSCAAASVLPWSPELRVAVRLLLRTRIGSTSLDEDLRNLFVALEAMFELRLGQPAGSTAAQALSRDVLRRYREAIRNAANTCKDLRRGAAAVAEDPAAKASLRFLDGAVRKLENFEHLEPGYGTKVRMLLEEAKLPDRAILDNFYRANPEGARKRKCTKWTDVLSRYRGNVMHRGYVGVGERGFRTENAIRVLRHLQDLLLRLVFMELGYDGEYRPPVITFTASCPLNWVTPETPAEMLGFSGSD